jgi:hypothetical protein
MKTYGGEHIQIHTFLTSTLVGGEWRASRPGCFTPDRRTTDILWTGVWVGYRAGLDDMRSANFLLYRDLNSELSVVQPVASRQIDCAELNTFKLSIIDVSCNRQVKTNEGH